MANRRKSPHDQAPHHPDKQRRSGRGSILAGAVIGLMLIGGLWIGRSLGGESPGQAAPQSEVTANPSQGEAGTPTLVTDLAELPFGPAGHIEVAYFHRTHRCWSCTEAERLVRKTLDEHFSEDMASGRISLVVVDVEQPENADIAAKYDAWGSSLYIGITRPGERFVYPVADIWYTIKDESLFVPALQEKISLSLGES